MNKFLSSTIGRKQLVAIGGLGLALFVFAHMAGNMLILVSPEAYNLYGHALITNPLIYVAEAGLVSIFVLHVVYAIILTLKNRSSRETQYAVSPKKKATASLASRTMWFQGLVILAFVVLHLLTFKYGYAEGEGSYTAVYNGVEVRDLHKLVIEVFTQPVYVVGYIFTLLLMFGHLSHGFSSTFQSLGFSHPKYTPMIKAIGVIYSVVVVGGFISQPLYVYFIH